MMALGDNIRKLREERGMTQQQMADKLYVSRQTVCRWENGSRCPDLITAKKIATEFGVSLDALISDDDMEDLERISGAGKFIKYKRKVKLQEYQRKILEFLHPDKGVTYGFDVEFTSCEGDCFKGIGDKGIRAYCRSGNCEYKPETAFGCACLRCVFSRVRCEQDGEDKEHKDTSGIDGELHRSEECIIEHKVDTRRGEKNKQQVCGSPKYAASRDGKYRTYHYHYRKQVENNLLS